MIQHTTSWSRADSPLQICRGRTWYSQNRPQSTDVPAEEPLQASPSAPQADQEQAVNTPTPLLPPFHKADPLPLTPIRFGSNRNLLSQRVPTPRRVQASAIPCSIESHPQGETRRVEENIHSDIDSATLTARPHPKRSMEKVATTLHSYLNSQCESTRDSTRSSLCLNFTFCLPPPHIVQVGWTKVPV